MLSSISLCNTILNSSGPLSCSLQIERAAGKQRYTFVRADSVSIVHLICYKSFYCSQFLTKLQGEQWILWRELQESNKIINSTSFKVIMLGGLVKCNKLLVALFCKQEKYIKPVSLILSIQLNEQSSGKRKELYPASTCTQRMHITPHHTTHTQSHAHTTYHLCGHNMCRILGNVGCSSGSGLL